MKSKRELSLTCCWSRFDKTWMSHLWLMYLDSWLCSGIFKMIVISPVEVHPLRSFVFCLSTMRGISAITEQMVIRSEVWKVSLFRHLKCIFVQPRVQEKSLDAMSQTSTNYILQRFWGIITYTVTFAFKVFPEIWGNYGFTVTIDDVVHFNNVFGNFIMSQRCPVCYWLAQWWHCRYVNHYLV